MAVSLRLTKEEEQIIKGYAEINKLSMSELFRQTVLEKIEDEYDLKLLREALTEWEKDPIIYTHEEVGKMLDLG